MLHLCPAHDAMAQILISVKAARRCLIADFASQVCAFASGATNRVPMRSKKNRKGNSFSLAGWGRLAFLSQLAASRFPALDTPIDEGCTQAHGLEGVDHAV